jgi:hypothetical protein
MTNPPWRDERVSMTAIEAMINGEKRLVRVLYMVFLIVEGKRIV